MKINLIKAGITILILSLFLAVGFVAYGQDPDTHASNGTNQLPNKKVTSSVWSTCSMTDNAVLAGLSYGREEECHTQSTFSKGEIRAFGHGVTYTLEGKLIVGQTSCACSLNAVWTRTMKNTENFVANWIDWKVLLLRQKPDCSFEDQITYRVIGCSVYKTNVAENEDLPICPPDSQFQEGDPPCHYTPIVIDLNNDGMVRMTNRENGVKFDIAANGRQVQIPWLADDIDGWLVLDIDRNGIIVDGEQLLGNATPFQAQPLNSTEQRHGYRVLRTFDDNKDGLISAADAVWKMLGIWRDANHNGVSEPGEIVNLEFTAIESISLDYKESRRKDQHGNEFRYRSGIQFSDGRKGLSFDVILSAK